VNIKFLAPFLLTALAATGTLSAAPVTVNAELLAAGPNDPNLKDSAGYLVGPYTLQVNGTTYLTMCVDIQDWSYVGTTYSAYETQLSSGNFANTFHPSYGVQYDEEAYLMTQLLKPGADRIDIQDAAWAITDSAYTPSAAAKTYINLAVANYSSVNLAGFDLITDVFTGSGRSQEFLIDPGPSTATPEPASLFLLGGGLLAVGLVRRRKAVR
jgi:hypothetical protein